MASAFKIITEEFIDDMDAIRSLVVTFSDPQKTAKSRIAAANSATLLVAATFEEFIRVGLEMISFWLKRLRCAA